MIDDLADFIAVFRLTRLAIVDDFPPILKARFAILQRFPEDSWQVKLGTCPWCLSVWIGVGVLMVRRTRVWRALRFVLVSSAISGVLSEHA